MKTEQTKSSPRLRYDIILISALLILAVAILSVTLLTRVEGKYVEIILGVTVVAEYSLDKDGEYLLNGGTNILVIEDGVAYVRYADCPGQHCVKSGKIRYVGESITCAYNEVIVVVKGSSDDGVDLVS